MRHVNWLGAYTPLEQCTQNCYLKYGAKPDGSPAMPGGKVDALALAACFVQCDVQNGVPPTVPPGGLQLPPGTVLPAGLTIPQGWVLPAGLQIPGLWTIPGQPWSAPPQGTSILNPIVLPIPWTLPGNLALPQGWSIPAGLPLPMGLPAPPPVPEPIPAPAPAPAPGPITPAKEETPWGLYALGGGALLILGYALSKMSAASGGAGVAYAGNPRSAKYRYGGTHSNRTEILYFMAELSNANLATVRHAASLIGRRQLIDQAAFTIAEIAKPRAYGGTVGRWIVDQPFTTATTIKSITDREIEKTRREQLRMSAAEARVARVPSGAPHMQVLLSRNPSGSHAAIRDNPTRRVGGLLVASDDKWKDFIYGYDVPKRVRESQFDWLDDAEGSDHFFKYRGTWYHLLQFTRTRGGGAAGAALPDLVAAGWDGIENDSYSTGTLIKVSSSGEQYKVASYRVAPGEY